MELRLTTDPSVRRLLGMVEDYSADIGVIATAGQRLSLIVKPLLRDELAFYCTKRFACQARLESATVVTPDDLARLPVIVAPGMLATATETVEEWLYAHAPVLAPTYRVGTEFHGISKQFRRYVPPRRCVVNGRLKLFKPKLDKCFFNLSR